MENNEAIVEVKEKKQDNLNYELLRKKKRALITVMVCALVWLGVIALALYIITYGSFEAYKTMTGNLTELSADNPQSGYGVLAVFLGMGTVMSSGLGVIIALLLGVFLLFIGSYLLMAIIAWILALKNKKCAAVFCWLGFIIYLPVLFVLCKLTTVHFFVAIFNLIGLIIAVLHAMYTVQYSKVFKEAKSVEVNK